MDKETITNSLTDIATKFNGNLEKATDYLATQAVDLYNQTLSFYFIYHVLHTVWLLIAMIAVGSFIKYCWSVVKNNDRSDSHIVFMIFGVPVFIALSIFMHIQALKAIQVQVAPKLYMIEFIADLVQKQKGQ